LFEKIHNRLENNLLKKNELSFVTTQLDVFIIQGAFEIVKGLPVLLQMVRLSDPKTDHNW
jgi:hypothetical protein